MKVSSIDVQEAKKQLKACPKIVQDYVRSLEHVYEISKETNRLLMKKLRENGKVD